MTVLLDTDVLVDFLRGTEPARVWLNNVLAENFQVPGIVAMELLAGCRNRVELERMQEFIRSFDVVWPETSDFASAYELLAAHWLTSRIGIPDCIIAAMAVARSARLYTFNLKQFQSITGLDVQQPYKRNRL